MVLDVSKIHYLRCRKGSICEPQGSIACSHNVIWAVELQTKKIVDQPVTLSRVRIQLYYACWPGLVSHSPALQKAAIRKVYRSTWRQLAAACVKAWLSMCSDGWIKHQFCSLYQSWDMLMFSCQCWKVKRGWAWSLLKEPIHFILWKACVNLIPKISYLSTDLDRDSKAAVVAHSAIWSNCLYTAIYRSPHSSINVDSWHIGIQQPLWVLVETWCEEHLHVVSRITQQQP